MPSSENPFGRKKRHSSFTCFSFSTDDAAGTGPGPGLLDTAFACENAGSGDFATFGSLRNLGKHASAQTIESCDLVTLQANRGAKPTRPSRVLPHLDAGFVVKSTRIQSICSAFRCPHHLSTLKNVESTNDSPTPLSRQFHRDASSRIDTDCRSNQQNGNWNCWRPSLERPEEGNGLLCPRDQESPFKCKPLILPKITLFDVLQSTNTVIMGRKTWESIPPRFRPLKDRSNIVISRSISQNSVTGGIHASSIEDAVKSIPKGSGEKVFVIGGAQIYREALQKVQAKRILLTRVLSEFECDTFFPITLGEDGKAQGWVRRSQKELDDWVGESVAEGILVEEGTAYVFEMWERSEDPN